MGMIIFIQILLCYQFYIIRKFDGILIIPYEINNIEIEASRMDEEQMSRQ